MTQTHPPRRAVFTADPITRSWLVESSRGWPSEDAAQEAVWLLDTDVASVRIPDFAGCFTLGPASWVIVRGCTAPLPNPTGRYWREAIALDDPDFAALRFNAMRILPSFEPRDLDGPHGELEPPRLPEPVTAADDLARLRVLVDHVRAQRTSGDLQLLLAAVLDREHTLVTRSPWGFPEIELLLLVLPPRLRRELTFHSCATSLPRDPVPRLVLSRLDTERPFETGTPLWGHRLPAGRAAVPPRARGAAAELIALLGAPERLVEAHEAYERDPSPAAEGGALLTGVEAVIRSARTPATYDATDTPPELRPLADAGERAGAAVPEEPGRRTGAPAGAEPGRRAGASAAGEGAAPARAEHTPAAFGEAVAMKLRAGDPALEAPARVMERFFTHRRSHPSAFAEFSAPLQPLFRDATALPARDADAARIRAMLMLLAAARADAAGMVSTLPVPVPADVVERLGGAEAWTPPDQPRIGRALHALTTATPDAAGEALRALAALGQDVEPAGRARLARTGVDYMRWAYRHVPPAEWESTLRIAVAGLDLFRAALSAARASADGGRDVDLFAGASDPLAAGPAGGLAERSDTEIFLAFLGAEGARRRPAEWEIRARADVLVAEVFRRITASSEADDASAEGIHWSLALLDRIRRREIEVQFILLAIRLLRRSAGAEAGAILRSYLDRYPSAVPWLFDHPELRELLERGHLLDLYVDALDGSLLDAARSGETAGAVALAARLRDAGVELTEDELQQRLATTLGHVAAELSRADGVDRGMRLPAVRAALTAIVERNAVPALDRLLRAAAPAPAPEPPAVDEGYEPAVAHAGHFFSRGRLALLGGTSIAVLVLTLTFAQRWLAPSAAPVLAEARGWASVEDHARVVELLSRQTLDGSAAEAFAWDSLLARSAFQQAARLPAGDVQRRQLLALSYQRADRALAVVPPFAPGTDLLRLLRAEACLEGELACDPPAITNDLLIAARSASTAVSRRAAALLTGRGR